MTIKALKKFAEFLNRSEGISLTPIIVIMVVMSVMGGVFTSIMGGWKVSAPLTVNSSKAFFQAEIASMFALQDAQYRFYSKDTGGNDMFNFGASTAAPYVVSSVTTGNITEVADYWFEMPNSVDDVTTGTNDDVLDDDLDDGDSSDDLDGDGVSDLYTIVATGRVDIGATVAKRQIKVLAYIIPSVNTVAPGVQTTGVIIGTGGVGFGMNNPSSGATVTYGVGGSLPNPPTGGSETVPPIVYRPAPILETFDEDFVKALATDQSHYNAGNFTVSSPDYPTASFYYYYNSPTDNMPNFTYVGGNLLVNTGFNANGVIWVKGDVTLTDTLTNNAIIICEGNIDFSGNASNINGGIIHYGGGNIVGNSNANAVVVNDAFFNALNAVVPDITVASWQEAVSAN